MSIKIGVVLGRTGRLAPLAAPVEFVGARFGRRPGVQVVLADSRSTAAGARAATEALARRDRVHLILSLGGTATLPAVAGTCEQLGVPCVSTVLPWQVYLRQHPAPAPGWAFHFGWGLDDIAAVFAELWHLAAGACVAGCLWNDGVPGTALRDPACGFVPAATAPGHQLLDLGAYAEPATDLGPHVAALRAGRADVVTSAATAGDLALFLRHAAGQGLIPRLVTCSRWLSYPFDVNRYGLDRVATAVSWTPRHQHCSSVDGTTAAELAEAYQQATGRPWLPPLGLAHALFEVALGALATAGDPTDGPAVAAALRTMRLPTMAGVLDWTAGPAPAVATIPLAGGQWRTGNPPRLVVVTSTRVPALAPDGELVLTADR